MKKYFNCADIIIIVFSCISIAWIIVYKFFWTNTVPVLNNFDKTADIIYTISTSIVASGIFYLFTIFIPKCDQIIKMQKQMRIYIKSLECASNTIIQFIYKGESRDKYSPDVFIQNVLNNNEEAERDFIKYYATPQYHSILIDSLKLHFEIYESILANYSNILPNNIKIRIVNLTKNGKAAFNNNPTIPLEINYHLLYTFQYLTFKEILNITIQLKKEFNWNETILWICR